MKCHLQIIMHLMVDPLQYHLHVLKKVVGHVVDMLWVVAVYGKVAT